MTERMNPPPLGPEQLREYKKIKGELIDHLQYEPEDSAMWKEYVRSYAIVFYNLFLVHYSGFQDFSLEAQPAAMHNAAVTIDELAKKPYGSQAFVLETIRDHIRREAEKSKLIPRIVFSPPPTESPLLIMAKALKGISRNPVVERRKEFVQPLLDKRAWSIFDWAKEARVSHHTASSYLHARHKSHPYSLKKLAEALGVTYEQLPK